MISLKVVPANNLKEKMTGLIGKKKAYPLLLKTRFGIHTFGLTFPIDVVVLDKNNKVVKLKESLRPNSLFFWNPKFDTLLELPQGEISNKKIFVCDKVKIISRKDAGNHEGLLIQ